MGLSINIAALRSRAIRIKEIGEEGIRKIRAGSFYQDNDDGGGLTDFYNGLNKFGNTLMAATLNAFSGFANWSMTGLVSWITNKSLFLINFNWNVSDKELDERIKQGKIALAGAKGQLAGTTLGYAVCGLIPTATIAVFNEALALHVLARLGEEAAEDIASDLAQLIRLQIAQWERNLFTSLFKNFRGLIRGSVKGIANILVNRGILDQQSVDKMEKNRNEPWSFVQAREESVERIADPEERRYAEEFDDAFQDACIEAGFVVAAGIDSFYAQARLAGDDALGDDTTVIIGPAPGATA